MGESVRERIAALSRRELIGLAALVTLVVAGAGLWYARSLPQGVEIRAGGVAPSEGPVDATGQPAPSGPPSVGPTTTAGPSSTPPPGPATGPTPVYVHVAGEVRRPGVYQLQSGDRVVDAIEAAGGPTEKAYLDALNLASPVADGQQVLVPRRGSPLVPPPGASPSAGALPPGGTTPVTSAPSGLVNVNTASAAELEELPGIGAVLAQAIVDHRTQNGPFASIDGLLDVSGIGPSTLEDIRDQVTV